MILLWNVWSILNESKLQNFLQIIDDLKVGVACVCETWFDSRKGVFSRMIKENGYKLIHGFREKKKGGGVAILYRENLNVKEGEESTTQYLSLEYVYIIITLPSKRRLILMCVYRKQEIPFSCFLEELENLIDRISLKCEAVMIIGDFNVWVDEEDDPNSKQLLTLMSSYGLTQQVLEPTHRGGHTLDQIYVNKFQVNVRHEVLSETMGMTTDHLPLLIEIPSIYKQKRTLIKEYRKINKVNVDMFKQDLKQAYIHFGNRGVENFGTLSTQYHELSKAVLDQHAPILKKKFVAGVPDWIDDEYKRSRKLRRKYERKWKKDKTEENMKNYIDQKKLCGELALSKQTTHYSKIIRDAGTCQKSLFRIADELLDKNKQKVLPYYSDPAQLADEFNAYFVDKVTKIRKSIPPATGDTSYYKRPFIGDKLLQFRELTEEEVKKLIQTHGIKTSMEDPIPSKLMQSSLDEMIPVLTQLVNQSLKEGSMMGVKESILNPLLKKSGLDADNKKNFRPVNNLLFLSKLVERAVSNQLNDHMTKNNLHEESQFAYKTHHNTENMMLGIVDEVLRGFDENQATVIIFLDLSAAFDTIDVDKFLEIMQEEIGIDGKALQWFKSFLEERTQRVKIENEYSESLQVPCGTPQGSILGPRIFNINVRSQPKAFKQCKFSSSSFADDSNGRKRFALRFQFENLKNEIVNCLHHIIEWSNAHYMKINPDKTEILLLRPDSLNNEVIIRGVIFEEQCIRFSTVVKNVGVWLDMNLNMDKHINQIVSHGFKILKDIGRIKKCLERSHIERLVHAVISSRLDYCNSLFMNVSKDNLFKLQKMQNAAAKLVLGRRKRESATLALRELHWLNVDSRIIFKVLLMVFKMLRGYCPNYGLVYKRFNGRFDDFLMLDTPNFKSVYGKRVFAYHASRLWNALPVAVRSEENVEKFKTMIKTILFGGKEEFKKKAFMYKQ